MCGKNQSTGRTKGPWESAIFMSGEVTRKLLPIKSTGWTRGGGGGCTPDFKWREWSIAGKTRNQKNRLGFQQNPKNFLHQKLTPKKSHAEFPNLQHSQKA